MQCQEGNKQLHDTCGCDISSKATCLNMHHINHNAEKVLAFEKKIYQRSIDKKEIYYPHSSVTIQDFSDSEVTNSFICIQQEEDEFALKVKAVPRKYVTIHQDYIDPARLRNCSW